MTYRNVLFYYWIFHLLIFITSKCVLFRKWIISKKKISSQRINVIGWPFFNSNESGKKKHKPLSISKKKNVLWYIEQYIIYIWRIATGYTFTKKHRPLQTLFIDPHITAYHTVYRCFFFMFLREIVDRRNRLTMSIIHNLWVEYIFFSFESIKFHTRSIFCGNQVRSFTRYKMFRKCNQIEKYMSVYRKHEDEKYVPLFKPFVSDWNFQLNNRNKDCQNFHFSNYFNYFLFSEVDRSCCIMSNITT